MANKNFIVISKMLAYVDKIVDYTAGADKSAFFANTMLLEACVFNLLQIGEIAGHLDEDFRKKYSEIPWSKIRGLRNRLVHDYEGVQFELLWQVVEGDVKSLKNQLQSINTP